MIRVLVIDDHPLFRRGVVELIGETDDLSVAGEAIDGFLALRLAESVAWDVAVIDLSLPRISGPELLKRLRVAFPGRPVVVLSHYPPEQMADRLRADGAAAYVSKTDAPEQLISILRAVVAGHAEDSPTPPAAPQLPHDRLSPREYQVFTLVHQGRTVSEIAAELDLALPTVSTHLKKVREKLGARTVSEVVAYAHRTGLAD